MTTKTYPQYTPAAIAAAESNRVYGFSVNETLGFLDTFLSPDSDYTDLVCRIESSLECDTELGMSDFDGVAYVIVERYGLTVVDVAFCWESASNAMTEARGVYFAVPLTAVRAVQSCDPYGKDIEELSGEMSDAFSAYKRVADCFVSAEDWVDEPAELFGHAELKNMAGYPGPTHDDYSRLADKLYSNLPTFYCLYEHDLFKASNERVMKANHPLAYECLSGRHGLDIGEVETWELSDALTQLAEVAEQLEVYPLLDDEDYSQLQNEYACNEIGDYLDDMARQLPDELPEDGGNPDDMMTIDGRQMTQRETTVGSITNDVAFGAINYLYDATGDSHVYPAMDDKDWSACLRLCATGEPLSDDDAMAFIQRFMLGLDVKGAETYAGCYSKYYDALWAVAPRVAPEFAA